MTHLPLILGVAAVLLLAIAAGVPIALALAAAGGLGLVLLVGFDFAWGTLGTVPYLSTARTSLVLVPMFVLMGMMMLHARLSKDLFDAAAIAFGRLKAGLGVAAIAACAGFAAVTGSSAATVATVGRVAVPEMVRHGYGTSFAAGIVAAAGTLGVIIPPSVVLVVYGVLAEVSIGQLLVAGIIPGVFSAVIYSTYIATLGRRHIADAGDLDIGFSDEDGRAIRREVLRRGGTAAMQSAVVLAIVVAGIYSGWMTVTEAGMVAALVVVILVAWRLRSEGPRHVMSTLWTGLNESANLTAMVFLLFVGGAVFSAFIVASRLPQDVASAVLNSDAGPQVVVVLILLAMIPLGMVLDSMSILLIVVPIVAPVVSALGVDMVWFGILMVKMIELGLITPPLGLNAFVAAGVLPGVSVDTVFKGLFPFIVLDVVTVGILMIFPGVVTWLPSLIN